MIANAKFAVGTGIAAVAAVGVYVLLSGGAALETKSVTPQRAELSGKARPAAVAGTFYPADATTLRKDVDAYVATGAAEEGQKVIALIAPHAGYEYSGDTAGKSYACLKGATVGRIVVIGLSHGGGPEPVWADDVASYATPLGDVPVDPAAMSTLKSEGLPLIAGAARREHSIEVQLPFLQEALAPGWKLVPILVANADMDDLKRAAEAVKGILDDSTVVCVSTDFTHYGASYGYLPFSGTDSEIKAKLEALDTEAVNFIVAKDMNGFVNFLKRTNDTICNRDGVILLLNLLPGYSQGRRIAYTTSGEKTGKFDLSVSYMAVAFTVAGRDKDFWGTNAQGEGTMAEPKALTAAEKATLLKLARASLVAAVSGGKAPSIPESELTDTIRTKRGAFVTLTIDSNLRGCIGYVEPIKPLYETVIDNASNAALQDPRFRPVRPEEVKNIRIEISAMSPLQKIKDVSKIEVGKHGIMLSRGYYKGLLLPQVATEYGWNREEFLRQTCFKAGLPPEAWKDPGTTIEIFSAEVFHEE